MKVIEIFSAKKGDSGLPRPKVNQLNLIAGYGIEDDKFAGKDLDKTVMIIGKKSYDIVKENGIDLELGSFGENIIFDFDPHVLKVGDTITIDNCILEITEKCSICKHLKCFGDKLPSLVKTKRGLYCKILSGGIIESEYKVVI